MRKAPFENNNLTGHFQRQKNMYKFLIFLFLSLASCSPYTEETEIKYQENREIINAHLEKLGMAESPFIELISESKLDQQRKKYIATLSAAEMKKLVEDNVKDVPKLRMRTPRSLAFFAEIKDMNDHKKIYEILKEKYPDLIIE